MITIGIIGLGYWGPNVLRAFYGLSECRVKLLCDLSDKNLKRMITQFPSLNTTVHYEGLLKDPAIDAIVVTVPSQDHYRIVKESLEAGKHVFVEKPLALSSHECQELIEISEKNKKILMVGHLMQYHPAVYKLRAYIQQGEIGNVRYIYSTRVNLGKIRYAENVLWSLAPHDITIICMLLENLYPLGVVSVGGNYIQKDICDVAFITLTFPNNIMASLHVSWLDPHKIRQVTVVGDKKMVVFDDMEASEKVRLYDCGVDYNVHFTDFSSYISLRAGDVIIPKIDMKEPLVAECKHFIDCILYNQKPQSDGYEGLKIVKILEAADESLKKRGSYIPINP